MSDQREPIVNAPSNMVTITERFRRVHQGGHHDVYCDGFKHLWVYGHECGKARIADPDRRVRMLQGHCDCWKYNTTKGD